MKNVSVLNGLRYDPSIRTVVDRFRVSSGTTSHRLDSIIEIDVTDREAVIQSRFEEGSIEPDSDFSTDPYPTPSSDPEPYPDPDLDPDFVGRRIETDGGTPPTDDSNRDETEATAIDRRRFATDTDSRVDDFDVEQHYREQQAQLQHLSERLESLETKLEEPTSQQPVAIAPELVHKVANACLQSEQISETEELDILRSLLGVEDDP